MLVFTDAFLLLFIITMELATFLPIFTSQQNVKVLDRKGLPELSEF